MPHSEDIICELVRLSAFAEDKQTKKIINRAAEYMEEQDKKILRLIARVDELYSELHGKNQGAS